MKIRHQKGIGIFGIIVVIVVLVIVAGIIIAASSGGKGDGGDEAGGNNDVGGICHTYCMGVIELECGSNAPVGACFGAWDCSPPEVGPHQCKKEGGY